MTDSEEIRLQLKKLLDEVQTLTRRVGGLERQVETLDQDREILEGNQRAIRSLEEATRLNKEHIDTLIKSVKLEVQVQGERTRETAEGVKDKVEEHIGNLVENIEKKKVVVIKETLVEQIRKFLRR